MTKGALDIQKDRERSAGGEPGDWASERVLVMAPVGQDASAMCETFRCEGFDAEICLEPVQCAREIVAGAGAVVLTEEALELGGISNLLAALEMQPPWSELPVIILTSGGETRRRSLLNLAATTAQATMFLERPVGKATLVRLLQVALNSRRRQYQVRLLLEAQAQLAAIVASSDDAIVSKTLDGIVTTWNAGAERIFGYSAAEMIGQSILRVIPPELKEEEEHILGCLRSGERISHYETIRVRKDGSRFPVSLTVSPIRDGTGSLVGASKIARDITERRRAEESLRKAKEEAEAASHAKDNFLAALSHELRTPLTPVLMTAAVLREDERLPGDVKDDLGMMERNVLLEARLIDDLLDLTRIGHGKLTLRSEACDVHSIIGLVAEMIRDEAREKEVAISFDLTAHNPTVAGDPARLQQVFWNLLRNAVKFAPAGGRIRIFTEDGGGESPGRPSIRIAVTDNGIGFDDELAKRIFEPFEQAVSGQTCHRGGLGLGLAIARGIVDMHGGVIRAESPGPGQGSTFTVELPVTPAIAGIGAEPVAAYADADRGPAPPGPAMRLLVVEDHGPTLQVLTRLLSRDGHQVVSASSLAGALAAARLNDFDGVISDLGLPDGTGIELMRRLRASHGLRGIALSGYGMAEDLRHSREAGFAAHLVKPVDINELRGALRRLSILEKNGMGECRAGVPDQWQVVPPSTNSDVPETHDERFDAR